MSRPLNLNTPEEMKIHVDNLARGFEKVHWGKRPVVEGTHEDAAEHYVNLCRTWLGIYWNPSKDEKELTRFYAIQTEMLKLLLDGRTYRWLGGATRQDCAIEAPYCLNVSLMKFVDQKIQCDRCYKFLANEEEFGAHLVKEHMESLRYYFEL